MNNINRRIMALESANADKRPIVIYGDEPEPTNPDECVIVRIMRFASPPPERTADNGKTD
jgi:hypothetical protein